MFIYFATINKQVVNTTYFNISLALMLARCGWRKPKETQPVTTILYHIPPLPITVIELQSKPWEACVMSQMSWCLHWTLSFHRSIQNWPTSIQLSARSEFRCGVNRQIYLVTSRYIPMSLISFVMSHLNQKREDCTIFYFNIYKKHMILLLIKNSQYFTIMKSTKFIINRTHVHNWSTHYIAMSF